MTPKSSIVSASIEAVSVTTNLAQLLAVGGIVAGVSALITAAPAQAFSFQNGELDFNGTTSNFYTDASTGKDLDINFNLSSQAEVSVATKEFSDLKYFPIQNLGYGITSNNGTFQYLGNNQYKLTKNLQFAFTNGVKLNLKTDSTFQGSAANGFANYALLSNAGSSFENNGDIVPTGDFNLDFTYDGTNDISTYQVNAVAAPQSQAVPEPFTIIGSIIGGTAAFRLRKKLSSTAKA